MECWQEGSTSTAISQQKKKKKKKEALLSEQSSLITYKPVYGYIVYITCFSLNYLEHLLKNKQTKQNKKKKPKQQKKHLCTYLVASLYSVNCFLRVLKEQYTELHLHTIVTHALEKAFAIMKIFLFLHTMNEW